MKELGFQQTKKVFNHTIVITVAFSGHALPDPFIASHCSAIVNLVIKTAPPQLVCVQLLGCSSFEGCFFVNCNAIAHNVEENSDDWGYQYRPLYPNHMNLRWNIEWNSLWVWSWQL